MLSTKLKEAAGNSADATLYVDDVFSTYLYTGNGSTQTITNGIDLAGKGGMVWIKNRSTQDFGNTRAHWLFDSARTAGNSLSSNNANAENTAFTGLIPFSSTGFSINTGDANLNGTGTNPYTYASWTFRKAAKFFDVVTYTGTGSARTIAHSLGVAPGMMIVKRTDTTGNWQVYSNGLTSAAYSIQLNLTAAQASAPTVWNSTAPTSSVFSVGTDATVNASGGTYVAYLFAHDTSSTGIIQCGSFATDGSGNATVNLGWEPQYVMVRALASGANWWIIDTMRGWSQTDFSPLYANSATNEAPVGVASIFPTATGFNTVGTVFDPSMTFIYMAIRRPNKPPTSGTQVFMPTATRGPVSGTASATNPNNVSNFPVDLFMQSSKSGTSPSVAVVLDRLRGGTVYSVTSSTNAETNTGWAFDSETGVYISGLGSSSDICSWMFKRAPGFFDEVCYTGTGSATTQAHNLTVVPELMIVKDRTYDWGSNSWAVYSSVLGATKYLALSRNVGEQTSSSFWNNTAPTSSVFTVGTNAYTNAGGDKYVAYLFATLAGISKVGSYTGNGTGQAIACGFSAGARFVLIKRTDSTGDWYTFDSGRGMVSVSSPYLLLNSTAAEVTGNNGVYASTGGFTLATSAAGLNASGGTYIFLAVA